MAADLDAVAGVAVVVGRVHDPGRQPQHALLDLLKNGQVSARAAGSGLGNCHAALLAFGLPPAGRGGRPG